MLGFIAECYKDKKFVKELLIIILRHLALSPIALRPKKLVIKLSVLILLQYNLFLINVSVTNM